MELFHAEKIVTINHNGKIIIINIFQVKIGYFEILDYFDNQIKNSKSNQKHMM